MLKKFVTPGLDPGVHVYPFEEYSASKTWMAGSDPRVKPGDGHDELLQHKSLILFD